MMLLVRLLLAKPLLAIGHAAIWSLRGLRALLAWAWAHPWPAATLVLALWLGWLQLHTLPARDAALAAERAAGDDLLVMLQSEQVAHQQTRRNYATAQLVAARAAQQQRAAVELRYKELAHHADTRFQQGLAAALAVADRYTVSHGLPDRTQPLDGTAAGTGSGPTAPAPGDATGSGDRSGGVAQLVAVKADDLRICTINTQRLIEARSWALSLDGN